MCKMSLIDTVFQVFRPCSFGKREDTNYRTCCRSVGQYGSAKGLLRRFVGFRALTTVILESVAFWVPTFFKNTQPEVCRSP